MNEYSYPDAASFRDSDGNPLVQGGGYRVGEHGPTVYWNGVDFLYADHSVAYLLFSEIEQLVRVDHGVDPNYIDGIGPDPEFTIEEMPEPKRSLAGRWNDLAEHERRAIVLGCGLGLLALSIIVAAVTI